MEKALTDFKKKPYKPEDDVNCWTDEFIKEWIVQKKILFVTNSLCQPGTHFLSALRTWIDYIPVHNFTLIYGLKNNKLYYGADVFNEIVVRTLSVGPYSKYDYVCYIDDDCYITDFEALIKMLWQFIYDDCWCIAGPQDGGVFCHRNHSGMMINTFLSFWNLKAIREAGTLEEFITLRNRINANKGAEYKTFLDIINEKNPELLAQMTTISNEHLTEMQLRRQQRLPGGESPYSAIVRNDPTNLVEPHQTPYSCKDEAGNFEPYYLIEQALVLFTGKTIMYFDACDYMNRNPEISDDDVDNSGLSSAIYYYSQDFEDRLIAVHTWFSRMYTKWPSNNVQLEHTKRINKIISQFGKL